MFGLLFVGFLGGFFGLFDRCLLGVGSILCGWEGGFWFG